MNKKAAKILPAFMISSLAHGAGQSVYPIVNDLANLKRETAAVCVEGVTPENTTGLSKIICTLKSSLGATSVGFFGPVAVQGLATIQTAAKLSPDTDGFDYKIDQWTFDKTTPAQTHKGVQYRFSADGKKGRVEKMDIPLANPAYQAFGFNKWTAAVYQWDGSNPEAQRLSLRFHQTKDASSKDYANTRWAYYHSAVINGATNTAELFSISASGDNNAAYKFQSLRNATHTLFKASTCTGNGQTCGSPHFECVANATNIVESLGNSFEDVAKGSCAAFAQSSFTMTAEEPVQANLDLLNDTSGRLMTLKTDEVMQR